MKQDTEVSDLSHLKNNRTDQKSTPTKSFHSSMCFFSLTLWDITLASVSDLCTLAMKPLCWEGSLALNLVNQTRVVESLSLKVFQDLAEESHSLPHPILATVLLQERGWTR